MPKAVVRVFTIAFAASLLTASLLTGVTPALAAQQGDAGDVPEARAVRTTWTSEFDADRPAGVTYVPPRRELLVADPAATNTSVVRLDRDETEQGELQLPALSDPSTLAFDSAGNQLTAVTNDEVVVVSGSAITSTSPSVQITDVEDLALDDSCGATYDAHGTWFVLDANGPEIVSVANRSTTPGTPVHTSLASQLGGRTLRGLAFNPSDGLLYVMSPDEGLLYGLDTTGTIVKRYDIGSLDLRNPTAMTFAPSTDSTDAAATQNLFIADAATQPSSAVSPRSHWPPLRRSRRRSIRGRSCERSTRPRSVPGAPTRRASRTSRAANSLEICDSEVEEITGAGYHGVNLWQITPRER